MPNCPNCMAPLVTVRQRESMEAEPDEVWKTIPALFGLPVESNAAPLSCVPWATWILCGVIGVVSVAALFDLKTAIGEFGFVPAEAFRYGGLTLLTSFFL